MKKILLLLIIAAGLMIGCEKKNEENPSVVNGQDLKSNRIVEYEVKEIETSGKRELYINNEKFTKLDWDYYNVNSIYNIGDLLLVGICTSKCDAYFVDGNSQIVGMIDYSELYQADVVIKPRFVNYYIEKVENNNVYITSYQFTYQDGSSVCNYNDNDVVKVTEKFTYLGNNIFSEGTTVETITKKNLLEIDKRFMCSTKSSDETIVEQPEGRINYEVKINNGKGDLYINGKLFDAFSDISYSNDKIYSFGDVLLVGVCRAICEEYFVNSDGEVIGNFLGAKMMAGGIDNIIVPKYHSSNISYWIEKVEGNDLYVTSFKYNYQDGSSICEYDYFDEVKVTEKFTYLGNYFFSSGIVIESQTKQDVINKDKRFTCASVNVTDSQGKVYSIDFTGLLHKLEKKVDNYEEKITLVTRESCNGDEGSNTTVGQKVKELSMDSITKVIDKLRSSKKIEYLSTSRTCSLYNFQIGNDLTVFEADDDHILLVGIEGNGFAFHYDDSVLDFFKSLS